MKGSGKEEKARIRQENGKYHRFTINVEPDLWLEIRLIAVARNISAASFFIESAKICLNKHKNIVDKNK